MKKYKFILIEELLPGFALDSYTNINRGYIYKIESLSEFKKLKPGVRGIIVDNNLYMCEELRILHNDIIKYIQKHNPSSRLNKIKKNAIMRHSFNDFLTVQKGEKHKDILYCGEAQPLDVDSVKMIKYIEIAKKSGVTLLPKNISEDRKKDKK